MANITGNSRRLKASYMVSGTRDNPPPETTLASVYMWKRFPYRPSQSWPCMIIHNHYWIIKYADVLLSLSFPRSFDRSGFCKVNFHFLDSNFCFNSFNLGISWHSLRREWSRSGEPSVKKSCPARQGYPTCRGETTRPLDCLAATRGHSYKRLFKFYNDTSKS